jgi:hypothetical protein
MDPEANLKEQMELVLRLQVAEEREEGSVDPDALRLAELVDALDCWLRSGGFLPAAWRRPPPNLNGLRVERRGTAIFVSLPKELHRDFAPPHCKCGHERCTNAWDALAIATERPAKDEHADTTWMVHHPEAQP